MTLIHGPWKTPDPDDGDQADPPGLILPGRSPKRDQSNTGSSTGASKELEPYVVEAEIVDDPADEAPVPVDLPAVPDRSPIRGPVEQWVPAWRRTQDRKPVVPAWVLDSTERRAVSRWARDSAWHHARYHLVRGPKYGGRVVLYAPRGLVRSLYRGWRWASAADLDEERRTLGKQDAKVAAEYLKQQAAKAKIQQPLFLVAVVVFTLLGVTAGLLFGWLPVTAIAVVVFAFIGRDETHTLIDHAVVTQRVRKLTPQVVLRAFANAGLAGNDQNRLTFATDVTRDGPGWSVVVDLPYGTAADKAIRKRVEIAAGLDYDERCVFLSRVRGPSGSARRVRLWVAEQDPLSVPAGRSPLIGTSRTNFWQPFPWGLDERGNVIMLCMLWLSFLIGSVPRMGKSFTARTVALAAALDPDVRLYVYDLKGSPDWKPFRHVAHRLQFGDRPDPETGLDPVEQLLGDMHALQAEVDHRYRTLRGLPPEVVPEGKLTEDLARSKAAGMPLVLVIIDEVQRAFEHKVYGSDLEDVLTDLAKAAPAVGIMLLAATQKPDAKAMPSRFRDQFLARFALRVTSRDVSDVVLGAGAYSEGLDASRLDPEAKGCGLLRGTGDIDVRGGTVRTFLADGRDAEAICKRARVLRDKAGTLSGVALGESPVAEKRQEWSVVADLLVVMGTNEERMHSDILCERLAKQWPDRYGSWGPTQLQVALQGYDVKTERNTYAKRPDGSKTNRAGVYRNALLEAGG